MRPTNLNYYVEAYAAAERIVLRSGCGAATVRAVALESGLSPSTLRHHYRNQSHLLACAFAAVEDHFVREVHGRSHLLYRDARIPIEDAVHVLVTRLPTERPALDRLRLLHAYKAWARHDWGMAIVMAGFDDRLLDQCLRVCLALGLTRVQALRQARVLRALLTGLAEEIVTLAGPPEGERDLGLPDRLTDRGVRAVLAEHLTALVDRTSPAQLPSAQEPPPVDRAG